MDQAPNTPTIGIPRSLFYYFYPDSWKLFFEELDFKVVLSHESTKESLNKGTKITMIDNCLPVKLYFGHVTSLVNNVDYLFVPRMVSTEKAEYLCPKFIGIPDIIRQTFTLKESTILEPVINYNEKMHFWHAAKAIRDYFNLPTKDVLRAYLKAVKAHKDNIKRDKNIFKALNSKQHKTRIGIIGHEYVLKDKILGQPIINGIEKLGCEPVPSHLLSWLPKRMVNRLVPKPLYWTKNKHLFEATAYLASHKLIDGFIQINTFPCGPDSFMSHLVERKIQQFNNIPAMTLTLDEHTGMAGINTRIEAFVDLIERRKMRA